MESLLSEWAREVLLREARRSTDDAVFTELVATRMLLVNLIKPLILGEKVSPTWITEAMTMVRKEKAQGSPRRDAAVHAGSRQGSDNDGNAMG